MVKSKIVSGGVRKIGGQDVRLKDVDVDADADGFPGADGADGGDRWPTVVEDLPAVTKDKCLLPSGNKSKHPNFIKISIDRIPRGPVDQKNLVTSHADHHT